MVVMDTFENEHVCLFLRALEGGGGGFHSRCVLKDAKHENHPNVGDLHAQCVQMGTEH